MLEYHFIYKTFSFLLHYNKTDKLLIKFLEAPPTCFHHYRNSIITLKSYCLYNKLSILKFVLNLYKLKFNSFQGIYIQRK